MVSAGEETNRQEPVDVLAEVPAFFEGDVVRVPHRSEIVVLRLTSTPTTLRGGGFQQFIGVQLNTDGVPIRHRLMWSDPHRVRLLKLGDYGTFPR